VAVMSLSLVGASRNCVPKDAKSIDGHFPAIKFARIGTNVTIFDGTATIKPLLASMVMLPPGILLPSAWW
jgi:hypothetical protein